MADTNHASSGDGQPSGGEPSKVEEAGNQPSRRRSFRRRLLIFLLVAVALTAVFLALDVDKFVRAAGDWIEALGPAAAPLFLAFHVIAVVALLPGAVFPLMAGFLFGPLLGAGLSAVGKTVGALVAFGIARYMVGGHRKSVWLQRLRVRFPGAAKIEKGLVGGGWKSVAMIRLIPAIPFKLSNYLLGWTHVRFRDFLVGTLLGTLPFSITSAYLGSFASELGGLGKAPLPKTGTGMVLYSAAVAIALVAAIVAIIKARRLLREQADD